MFVSAKFGNSWNATDLLVQDLTTTLLSFVCGILWKPKQTFMQRWIQSINVIFSFKFFFFSQSWQCAYYDRMSLIAFPNMIIYFRNRLSYRHNVVINQSHWAGSSCRNHQKWPSTNLYHAVILILHTPYEACFTKLQQIVQFSTFLYKLLNYFAHWQHQKTQSNIYSNVKSSEKSNL